MNITKYGHCCMSIEQNGCTLLTDPGSFTRAEQERLIGIDAVLYTHEHQDHFHLESLRIILKNNPKATVICNRGTAILLERAGIPHQILDHEGELSIKGVSIKGFGTTHAIIHESLPVMQNTGLYIADRLWYPGDAFPDIPMRPEIMALPITAPWMKLSEAVDYALKLKPSTCFGVHDAFLSQIGLDIHHMLLNSLLGAHGVTFLPLELNKEYAF